MPFGESFLSTIKSNKSIMLDKSKRFRKTTVSYDWSKSQQFNTPKATPQKIKRIREKIQRENKRNRIILITTTILIMLIMASILMYLAYA